MDRDKMKNTAIILLVIITAVNTWNIGKLKAEMNIAEAGISGLRSNIDTGLRNMDASIQQMYGDMEQKLQRAGSFFSESSAEVKLENGELVVTMKAVPKEIRNDERLIAKIKVNEKVYEQEADENYQTVFRIDPAKKIEPELILQSENGIRRESLDPLSVTEALSIDVVSNWEREPNHTDKRLELNMWLKGEKESLPFTRDQIEKAEFIVAANGISPGGNQGGGQYTASVNPTADMEAHGEERFDQLQGDRIEAEELFSDGLYSLGYSADLSEYADREDSVNYEVHFSLITKDGIRYIHPLNPIASFSSTENSSSTGINSGTLMPVLQ